MDDISRDVFKIWIEYHRRANPGPQAAAWLGQDTDQGQPGLSRRFRHLGLIDTSRMRIVQQQKMSTVNQWFDVLCKVSFEDIKHFVDNVFFSYNVRFQRNMTQQLTQKKNWKNASVGSSRIQELCVL